MYIYLFYNELSHCKSIYIFFLLVLYFVLINNSFGVLVLLNMQPSRILATGRTVWMQSMKRAACLSTQWLKVRGLIGKKVKSTSFELKFEARKDGGSICKLNGEYETNEDSLPTEAETKEMMGSMVSMFKVIEGYLVANPAAYA